jgi:hypothetical protein
VTKLTRAKERSIGAQCFDDPDLKRTEELKQIVSTLSRFKDGLSRLIHAWEGFERRHLRFLEPDGKEILRTRWQSYIDKVQGEVSELQSLHMLVSQNLDLFKSTRDGVSFESCFAN